jgi:hypothetical protein
MSPTDPPGKSDRTDQHTEVSSTATREALGKLGQWLDLDPETQLVHFGAAPLRVGLGRRSSALLLAAMP